MTHVKCLLKLHIHTVVLIRLLELKEILDNRICLKLNGIIFLQQVGYHNNLRARDCRFKVGLLLLLYQAEYILEE